ncbi:MAG: tetratricopeptide repeat protein [Candidatus Eremiobacteraeota bacterium]|nr:tetratricopeptide repeat protein [Candidatus Eremiobacteraeota bacterium]
MSESLETALKVEEIAPDNIDNRILLARIYMSKNQPEKADQYLDRVLEKKSDNLLALDMKLTLWGDTSRYDEVGSAAEKILNMSDVPEKIRLKALLALGDVAFFRDRNYNRAEKYYEKAHDLFPRDARPLFSLANVASVRRQYKKTHDLLMEIEKNKDSLDREELIELYKWLGDSNIFFGKDKEAIKKYKKAMELAGKDREILLRIAYACLYIYDLESAHRYLGDLPYTRPDDIDVVIVAQRLWRNEARFYRALEALEGAREKALMKNEFQPDLWWTLGNLYRMLGRYEDAEKIYSEYVKIQPDAIQAHLGIASCILAKGDLENGEKFFDKWRSRREKTQPHEVFEIYHMKALVYMKHLEDFPAAEKNLELFKKYAPKDEFEPYLMMGYLRLLQGRVAEARKEFQEALEIGEPEYFIRLEIAGMCSAAYYPDLAMEYIKSAESGIEKLIPPVRAAMYYRCARILYGPEDVEIPLLYAEKSCKADPELPEAWILLGRLYREAGNEKKADMAINKALSLEPENKQALFEKEHPGSENPYLLFPE